MIPFEPYNPAWADRFLQLKQRLETILSDYVVDIQHVGSTAVPGLPAKPVLDIDIIIQDQSKLPGISSILEKAGYHNRGDQGIPGRFAFRQQSIFTPGSPESMKWMKHHLYVCFSNSLALKNHLLFRNALLKNKALIAQYADLKLQLASKPDISRQEYTIQKTAFILRVLKDEGVNDDDLRQISDANR